MNISLKSKHALIGGSSKGLGLAVAKQLAHSGAKVTLVARSEDLLHKIIKQLNKETNCKHEYLICNYNNHEEYRKIISEYIDNNTDEEGGPLSRSTSLNIGDSSGQKRSRNPFRIPSTVKNRLV